MSYALWIPVRNEANTLESVLYWALEQDDPPARIYACVNGSTDATQDIVQKMAWRFQQVVPLVSDPWKSNAWNAILQQSLRDGSFHDVMVFCDGDISLPSYETLWGLVQSARESADIMIGASVIQLPSHRKKPYKPNCPPGQLYVTKKEMLDILDSGFDWWMPPWIINDDLFLALLAFPKVSVTENAFCYSLRPSMPDLLLTQLRILRWIRQLIDMGMETQLLRYIDRISHDPDNSFIRKWKYRLIPFFAQHVELRPDDHLWTITDSTKNPIPRALPTL